MCTCICMHVFMYVFMHICMYACMYVFMYVPKYAYTCVYVCVHTYLLACLLTYLLTLYTYRHLCFVYETFARLPPAHTVGSPLLPGARRVPADLERRLAGKGDPKKFWAQKIRDSEIWNHKV